MKKSSKSSLKKRSPDISLQHKNEASYKFSKKKLLHLADFRAGAERVNDLHNSNMGSFFLVLKVRNIQPHCCCAASAIVLICCLKFPELLLIPRSFACSTIFIFLLHFVL